MSGDDDFIRSQGPAFLAHLLRRLSDELVGECKRWYEECGIEAPPRTTSTLIALDDRGPLGVTELSVLLRQSHQLVLQWIRLLRERGLVRSAPDKTDARRTLICLTPKGRREVEKLRVALKVIGKATKTWIGEARPDLCDALWRLERLNRDRSFLARIRSAGEVSKARPSKAHAMPGKSAQRRKKTASSAPQPSSP
jgi:DNA-binding MarR family transcriptional regulator